MAIGWYWASVSLVIFIGILSLDIMGFFSRKTHFDVDGRVRHMNRTSDIRYADTIDRQ